MRPGKRILCLFILLNFMLYSPFAFCDSDQEEAKRIQEKLMILKNLVIQERLNLKGLNEELKGQNNKLSQENAELRQTISKLRIETEYLTDKLNQISKEPKSQTGQKIVYKRDSGQEEKIQQLQRRIVELNQTLLEKTQEIDRHKAKIEQLNRVIDMAYNEIDGMLSEKP